MILENNLKLLTLRSGFSTFNSLHLRADVEINILGLIPRPEDLSILAKVVVWQSDISSE